MQLQKKSFNKWIIVIDWEILNQCTGNMEGKFIGLNLFFVLNS